MSQRQKNIDELKTIFPQHTEGTVVYIYNDVIKIVGEENHALVIPSCIERLLELPDNFVAPALPNTFAAPGFTTTSQR